MKIPTYEEYKNATEFARFRYRWGIFVNTICLICFFLLLFFVVHYGEELASNPLIYGARKYNVECNCNNFQTGRMMFANSTDLLVGKGNIKYPGLIGD